MPNTTDAATQVPYPSPRQVQLVRHSWRLISRLDPIMVGDVFYSRLFFAHPSLRKIFPKDMTPQYQKLVLMLNHIVARMENPQEMTLELQQMGERHRGYGTRNSHYEVVGQALIWTLQQALGKDWQPELAAAWLATYAWIAHVMTQETPC